MFSFLHVFHHWPNISTINRCCARPVFFCRFSARKLSSKFTAPANNLSPFVRSLLIWHVCLLGSACLIFSSGGYRISLIDIGYWLIFWLKHQTVNCFCVFFFARIAKHVVAETPFGRWGLRRYQWLSSPWGFSYRFSKFI